MTKRVKSGSPASGNGDQVQRQALRIFREARAARMTLERELEEGLASNLSESDRLLAEAREAEAVGRQAAASVGIGHEENRIGASKEAQGSGDLLSELTASVASAKSASSDVREGVGELKRHRARRLMIGLVTACFLIASIAIGWWALQSWSTEQIYQSAVAALEAGNWPHAREELTQLQQMSPNYKDSKTLQKETYYRPAVAYLRASQPVQARAELVALMKLEPKYKDATKLWWSTWNLQEGECGKLLEQDPDVTQIPSLIQEGCNFTPDRFVKGFVQAWLAATDLSGLDQWIGANTTAYAKTQCNGSIVLCLDKAFPGVKQPVAQAVTARNGALEAIKDLDANRPAGGSSGELQSWELLGGRVRAVATATAQATNQVLATATALAGRGTPFSVNGASVSKLNPFRTAVVWLRVSYNGKELCQTYDLDWIGRRGWVIGQFRPPASSCTEPAASAGPTVQSTATATPAPRPAPTPSGASKSFFSAGEVIGGEGLNMRLLGYEIRDQSSDRAAAVRIIVEFSNESSGEATIGIKRSNITARDNLGTPFLEPHNTSCNITGMPAQLTQDYPDTTSVDIARGTTKQVEFYLFKSGTCGGRVDVGTRYLDIWWSSIFYRTEKVHQFSGLQWRLTLNR